MTMLIAWALAYTGFTALCLAGDRHHKAVWGRAPARRAAVALRALGFVLLAGSLTVCASALPGSTGIIAWLGLLTAAALPLIFTLPYAPRVAIGCALAAPTLAVVLALTHV